MKMYCVLWMVGVLMLSGCNRSGAEKGMFNQRGLESNAVAKSMGGEVLFKVITKSDTLHDLDGDFKERGHYSMIFQAKRKKGDLPLGGLNNSAFYTMFENDRQAVESKIRISQDSKTVSNKILLLLDFSGSIVNDCSKADATSSTSNLCFQIVNSSKQFIDKTVTASQSMAIYYFNSQRKILPLLGDPTHETGLLKASLDKLYSSEWREENLAGYNSTNLYGAVEDATEVVCHWFQDCEVGKVSEVSNVDKKDYDFATLVVFTDGHHTTGNAAAKKSEMLRVLPLYKRNYYYAIGLGDVDDEVLKSIGTSGYLKATQTDKLGEEFVKLGEQLNAFANSFYKFDYCPAQQGGVLDLRVDVKDTARGYEGRLAERIQLIDGVDFRCDL